MAAAATSTTGASAASPSLSPERVLVCDLDETIVCTTMDPSFFDYRPHDFVFENVLFFKRPHVDDMLLHAHTLGFRVVVFTAADADYADAIVRHVFLPLGITPLTVLSRKHCVRRTEWNTQTGSFDRYSIKPLVHLWNRQRIHVHDALLIDDKVCSAQHDPLNLFLVKPFTGDDWDDTSLLQFKHVLSFVHRQKSLKTMHALQLYFSVQRMHAALIERVGEKQKA